MKLTGKPKPLPWDQAGSVWFAWHPVKLVDGQWVWLEKVFRWYVEARSFEYPGMYISYPKAKYREL